MFDRHFIMQNIRERCIDSIHPELQSSELYQKLFEKFDDMLTEYLSDAQVAEIESVWTELSAYWMEMSYLCGMRDFLMFSCGLKNEEVQKLYEELLDEAVNSRRDEEMSRVVFHIPHFAYVENHLVGVYYEGFKKELEAKMADMGLRGWYYLDAKGAFYNRIYNEELLVFLGESQVVQSVASLFRETVKAWAEELMQEEYCYELDNQLLTFSVAEE